ncbi:hypothetical protein L345_12255, partial [Ophiophagus hannah]
MNRPRGVLAFFRKLLLPCKAADLASQQGKKQKKMEKGILNAPSPEKVRSHVDRETLPRKIRGIPGRRCNTMFGDPL